MPFLSPFGRRIIVASATIFVLSGCANPPAVDAQDSVSKRTETTEQITGINAFIAEASQRYAIPERWIRAVMQAESAGNARAVSHAGAMGLMQIMPGTWAELRAAHGFGTDPFDRRENILAGTAYLRAMYDRFGAPGFLAAYNAGPGRYAEHLRTGRSLPRETRRYVAALSRELGLSGAVPMRTGRRAPEARWQSAPLFAPMSSAENRLLNRPLSDQSRALDQHTESPPRETQTERTNSLFVSRSAETNQ